jgi:glucose/arabinose dehydrogenase
LAALAGLAAGPLAAPLAAQPSGFTLDLQLVTAGLARPVGVYNAGDGSGRLFIVEQAGTIRIWDGAQLLPTPFLSRSVECCNERGLLGLAFHPDYANNGLFYIHYSAPGTGNTVISRYQVSAMDPNVAEPASELVLLTQSQPFANHNGGQMAFGPDGFLYIALGDGGSAGDPQNNGQNLGTLLGKILRIDVSSMDVGLNYAIPLSNPFVGEPGVREEIWAWGLRNPWRFSFDRATGDLFIADVGQNTIEEIDFQPAASAGGENYGWRRMEGSSCFNPPSGCNDGSLVLPILEYTHALGDCSVTGGFRYRGAAQPVFAGVYFFSDFCTGRIWGAVPGCGGVWRSVQLLDAPFNITSLGEDEAGEVYVVESGVSNGKLHRLVVDTLTPQVFAGGFDDPSDLSDWDICAGL